MTKILLLAILLNFTNLFSQEKFDTYSSSYLKKDYTISLSQDKNNTIDFYIQTTSIDKISRDATLLVSSEKLPEFKLFISSLKETYVKWTKTALENKVNELNKDVEYEKLSYTSAFKYGKWNFDFKTSLSASFKILKDNYLMIVKSDELTASNNQYIKSDGFVIVFSSEKEFDDFLLKLDLEKANKYFSEKNSKEDLFKN